MRVIIMRGIPGSGKGYCVEHILSAEREPVAVCSADALRTTTDGRYMFDAASNSRIHSECFGIFVQALREGVPVVIVDNTNIHLWEFSNYVSVARLAGYDVEVVEVMPETVEGMRLCAMRNVHGVPAEAVARMAVEFEPYLGATKVPARF